MNDWQTYSHILTNGFIILSWIILIHGAVQNIIHFTLLVVANWALSKRETISTDREAWRHIADRALPISLLVPAFNESINIKENIISLLALHYPQFELIVINDGSSDDTMQVLKDEFKLRLSHRTYETVVGHQPIKAVYRSKVYSRLIVIDKENGGKADALNAGINVSRCPLFCSVDADSILDTDSLLRAVEPFLDDPDHIVAVGGTIRIANGSVVINGRVTKIGLPKSWLGLFQIVEYMRAFLMARVGWSSLNSMLLISGAFGIFNRSVAVEAGGYNPKTVGEDMEIIIRMHRYLCDQSREYKMIFVPDPVCWTEAPSDLSTLSRQRRRWQRGSLEVFFMHKDMLFRPKYGNISMIGLPNVFLSDVIGPFFDVIGYALIPLLYFLGILNFEFFLAYFSLIITFGVFLSLGSMVLAEFQMKRYPKISHLIILSFVAILENFGYRQINSFWRIWGFWEYLRGKSSWGKMVRKGF